MTGGLILRDCPHKTCTGYTHHSTACLDNVSFTEQNEKDIHEKKTIMEHWLKLAQPLNPEFKDFTCQKSYGNLALGIQSDFSGCNTVNDACLFFLHNMWGIFSCRVSPLECVAYLWRWKVCPSVPVSRCIIEPRSLLLTEMSRTQMEPMND